MCKSISVGGGIFGNYGERGGIVYFEGFTQLLHLKSFRIMRGCVSVQKKTAKCTWGKSGMYDDHIKIIAIF